MRPRRDPGHPAHWLQKARRILRRTVSPIPRRRQRFQDEFVRSVREAERLQQERTR